MHRLVVPKWLTVCCVRPTLLLRTRLRCSAGGFTVRDEGHQGMTLEDFLCHPSARAAGLTRAEVIALRLYTGPGYEPLNKSLRADSGRFSVTQYVPCFGFQCCLHCLSAGHPCKPNAWGCPSWIGMWDWGVEAGTKSKGGKPGLHSACHGSTSQNLPWGSRQVLWVPWCTMRGPVPCL